MKNKHEDLNFKEIELRKKEDELKDKREFLSSLSENRSVSHHSLDYNDALNNASNPVQMNNLDKSIQLSMRKDEEAVEALKSELLATDVAMQELRTESKKKDDEVLQMRLSLMKKKVMNTFMSSSVRDSANADMDEITAEEKKRKKAIIKRLEEESKHMKNIMKGLDTSLRTLKSDIKKREDLIRRKKKLGKTWVKVDARSRETYGDQT